MIPILYEHVETAFTTNGIGRLTDCTSCKVTEKRNGIYELEFVYPVTGQHFNDIALGCIVGCIHDDAKDIQPFDIYARTAPVDGMVTFYGHHISYRLGNVILRPFEASSCAAAMAGMADNAINTNPFTFWTDKQTLGTFTVAAPISVKEILGGTTGSILDVYGKAEYEFDKFTVRLWSNRGADKNIEIRYGKNLSDFEQELDIGETYNAVAPYWASSGDDGTVVMPPEGQEIITVAEEGEEIKPVPLDLSQSFQDVPTPAQLVARATSVLQNSEAWEPKENIDVSFVALWQTEEYKDIAALERVKLCDKVYVVFPALGKRRAKMQIVTVVYDVLNERYISMELGAARTSFADAIRASVEDSIVKKVPTRTSMMAAIDAATQLISGGLGGYVVIGTNTSGEPNEILIMDTDDINTAVNVIRINQAGIGFSSTGYAGTYRTAWTIDSHFVADFITSGTLNANIIRAGIIADIGGENYWNLDSGDMRLAIVDRAQKTADDANATAENVRTWMTFSEDGMKMGKQGSTYSTLVDDIGFHVLQLGSKITTIAKRRVAAEEFRVGSLNAQTRCVLREAGDGGLIITREDF